MAESPFSEFAAGDVIFKEGEAGDLMYIIESGKVELLRGGLRGEVLMKVGPGDFFGEMEVVEPGPRFVTAIARSRCRALRIESKAFRGMIEQNPDIALRVIARMAVRVRAAETRREEAVAAGSGSTPRPPAAATRKRASPAGGVSSPTPMVQSSRESQPTLAVTASLLHTASGKAFALDTAGGDILVGRTDVSTGVTAGVDLSELDENRTLSRRHAWLISSEDGWQVREEAGAANGSFVNDERVGSDQARPLKRGDRVRFGLVELEFSIGTNTGARG